MWLKTGKPSNASKVKFIVDIAEKVPVTLIAMQGNFSEDDYKSKSNEIFTKALPNILEGATSLKDLEDFYAGLLANQLSKKDAYGHYESPWVVLKSGEHTLMIDNSGEIDEKRGDALVHVRIYAQE